MRLDAVAEVHQPGADGDRQEQPEHIHATAWRIAAGRGIWRVAAGVRRRFACENGAVNADVHPSRPRRHPRRRLQRPDQRAPDLSVGAGLALVGLALLVGTILWWRRGRQEHPALAPLEVMSTRRGRRPPKATVAVGSIRFAWPVPRQAVEEPIVADPVDLQALVRSVPQAFDDLREPGECRRVVAEAAAAVVADDGEVVDVAEAAAELRLPKSRAVEEADVVERRCDGRGRAADARRSSRSRSRSRRRSTPSHVDVDAKPSASSRRRPGRGPRDGADDSVE